MSGTTTAATTNRNGIPGAAHHRTSSQFAN
jgi:hypothetical protein